MNKEYKTIMDLRREVEEEINEANNKLHETNNPTYIIEKMFLNNQLVMLDYITKMIKDKMCSIENDGYVQGIGYCAISNEMQLIINTLAEIIGK